MKLAKSFVVFLFTFILTSFFSLNVVFVKSAYAEKDPALDDIVRVGLRIYNRPDGLHDVYVKMQQTGNHDFNEFGRYKFYLEITGGEFPLDYWQGNSGVNDPPEKQYVFDFRGESGNTLYLRVKSGAPLGFCNGLFGTLDCRDLAKVPISFVVGGNGDLYINNIIPSPGWFTVDIEGDWNIGGSGYYRVRLKGFGDANNWGGAYSCTKGLNGLSVLGDFSCDFSSFPNKELTLALYYGKNSLGKMIDEYTFNTSMQDARISNGPDPIVGPNPVTQSDLPNDFLTFVYFSSNAKHGNYNLQIVSRGGTNILSTKDCSVSMQASVTKFVDCDFSYMNPFGSYDMVLINPAGVIIDRRAISLSEAPNPAGAGGLCACNGSSFSCPIIPSSTSCWFGFDPAITQCVPTAGLCTCSCNFVPGALGPGGVPLPPLLFGLADFQEWMKKGQQYIIAFGVFASVFIVPYFGVLLASGNPENIKKGLEWAKSWAFGLLLLLLSGLVIRVIGTDILGL